MEDQIVSIENDTHIKIPFDMIFMKYIFMNSTNFEIRTKALEVLITHFNQRDHLVKELSRSEIIVSEHDYRIYLNFLSKQRQLKQLTHKLILDEQAYMVYKKSPGTETKNTKNDIKNILSAMSKDIRSAEPIEKKRIQNMLRHIGMINDLLTVLLKQLIFKEIQYRDLFQHCIDFFYACCYENPSC